VRERANRTRASVLAAIRGVSGRARLEALLAGRVAPATLAALAQRRRRSTRPGLAPARTGMGHDHHRQCLARQFAHSDWLAEQREALNAAMETSLQVLSPAAPSRDAHPLPLPLLRAVDLLDPMPGSEPRGAEVMVAESGIDLARCETAPRLAAWAGVAPGKDASAGKPRSGKTRKAHRPLRAILPPRAQAAVRPKDP
jgi:transposase